METVENRTSRTVRDVRGSVIVKCKRKICEIELDKMWKNLAISFVGRELCGTKSDFLRKIEFYTGEIFHSAVESCK